MAALPVVPVMIAMAAMSAATAAVTMQQQSLNAEAEMDLQAQNNAELDKAAIRQYDDLSDSEGAIQEQASLESIQQQKDFIRARGRVNTLAGSSGTYGGSVDSMIRDLTMTKGQNLEVIAKNRAVQLDDIKLQAEQIRYGARAQKGNRIFSKPTAGLMALNTINAGVQGGLSAKGAYGG